MRRTRLGIEPTEVRSGWIAEVDAAQLTAHFPDSLLRTPAGDSRLLRDFEFLGAAIGEPSFIAAHTAAGQLQLANCWMPSVSLKTAKSRCASCVLCWARPPDPQHPVQPTTGPAGGPS